MRNIALQEELYEALLKEYAIEGGLLEKYKKIYRLHSKRGTFALKEMKYPQEEFAFIAGAMAHVQQNGFRQTNSFLPTRKGDLCLVVNGRRWTLSPWLKGREASYTRKEDCLLAADTLAQLHTASCHYKPYYFKGRVKWGELPQNFARKIRQLQEWELLAKEQKDFFADLYRANLTQNLQLAKKAYALLFEKDAYRKLNAEEEQKSGFCHHDYAPHNIMIDENHSAYVIDFDYCISDTSCHDFASFLQRILRVNAWRTNFAKAAYPIYTEGKPLPPGNGSVLAALLLFPQNYWQIAFTYYVEQNQPAMRQIRRLTDWQEETALRVSALEEMAELCQSKGDRQCR